MSSKGQTSHSRNGFLTRLKRAEAGNVLPMMAMAIVPIAGMIGSGLDMSRAYLAKAKLQNACDSAALATRRFMGGNPINQAAKDEGQKFFRFNFPSGMMGTTAFTPTIAANATDADVVEVRASTSVRTSIMKIFGKTTIPISVACNADQDFVHNDIMLVLDVTGSMNCNVGSGQSGCSMSAGAGEDSRIDALKDGAPKLYQALAGADPDVMIRYGFMPYSVATNVGRDLNLAHVRQTGLTYHDRLNGAYRNPATSNYSKDSSWLSTWRATLSPTAAYDANYQGFSGCVEERSSFADRANAAITISNTVAQEDIDRMPAASGEETLKWTPYDPGTTTLANDDNEVCPAPASRLATVASAQGFTDRLNAATRFRGGATHHDVGLIWAMRYLSPTGMFAADNPTTRGVMRVNRHIVFFTDGRMQVNGNWYSAVGIPDARRRTSGGTDDAANAKARFASACNLARQMATVWVVVLDVDFADDELRECASGEDQYFEVNTDSDLDNAFDTIGKEIGKLRLTK